MMAAAALSLHGAHFVLHAQDHAKNIGVERRGIAFRGLIGDRANPAFGAGVVHRDIETAKPCDGLVDQSADVILLADVGVDELGLRTEGAQLLHERLADLVTPTGDNHLCAFLGEGDGRGAPDAVSPPVIRTTELLVMDPILQDMTPPGDRSPAREGVECLVEVGEEGAVTSRGRRKSRLARAALGR